MFVSTVQKCAEYWPEDTVTHEGIEITVVTVTQEDDYSLRVFKLKVGHRKTVLVSHNKEKYCAQYDLNQQ